jgi:NADH:ubiquinone oxidoreductase subunit 5 (subunit L)/multisubunit Na+/H+ antiporter MnhA subunit
VWILAAATALMTAFYMFRLLSMTFFGAYRGPAWEVAGHGHAAPAQPQDVRVAADHGAIHPADTRAHGHAHEDDHEVSHGPADPHDQPGHAAADDHGGGHGHGPWHGPHESPAAMTFPLMALAVGAIVAGLVGIPAALHGGNAIEHFLEPSFTASAHGETHAEPAAAATAAHGDEGGEASSTLELGLMGFSVLIALVGIGLAWKFYVASPEISERLAQRFAAPHRLLSNKYYVDELYNTTFIAGTMGSGRSLWTFDRRVVDGAVNGAGWLTVIGAWFSSLTDRTVVDGAVNLVGWIAQESSYWFRRFQTGLVQNYAMLMLFGLFVFVSAYLIAR